MMTALEVKCSVREYHTVVRLEMVGYWIANDRGDTVLYNRLASRPLSNERMKVKYGAGPGADLTASKVYDTIRERCGYCLINDRGADQTDYPTRLKPGKPFMCVSVSRLHRAVRAAEAGRWRYHLRLPDTRSLTSGSVVGKSPMQSEINKLTRGAHRFRRSCRKVSRKRTSPQASHKLVRPTDRTRRKYHLAGERKP